MTIIDNFKHLFEPDLVQEILAYSQVRRTTGGLPPEKKRLGGSDLIKASHYMIADDLATNRVAVSRLLKQLENDGRLILYRNEIKILNNLD